MFLADVLAGEALPRNAALGAAECPLRNTPAPPVVTAVEELRGPLLPAAYARSLANERKRPTRLSVRGA